MESQALSYAEQLVYEALCEAARNREQCPVNIDLEVLADYSSCSMGSVLVKRLEKKGLIVVRRYQRFREVQIVATGEWTARSPSQHVERAHIPRGARSASYPSGGRIAKKARRI
jgi:hypothetical protein